MSDGPEVRFSEPEPVADLSEIATQVEEVHSLPDGYLVVRTGDDEEAPTEINLVLNWFEELNTRLSAATAGL